MQLFIYFNYSPVVADFQITESLILKCVKTTYVQITCINTQHLPLTDARELNKENQVHL